MISALLPFVLSVATAAAPRPASAAAPQEPAIRVTLNHRTYERGDRARINVRVRDDGYVVVLHTDASGHVRVLFPVDPGDDNFLKGGQDYEIRGRGDRDAFQVTRSGTGTVYAAVSADPYRFDDFVRSDHWDYGRLDDSISADPEAGMTNLVEQMANGNHFDYDVSTYTANPSYASSQQVSSRQVYIAPASYSCWYNSWDPWCGGYYPSPSYFSVNIGFGGFWGYHPYDYDDDGYGYRYGFGYGSGYGYGYGYGYPLYPIYGYGRSYEHGYYGATGYGYTVGRGWSYNHRPVLLGPGGGYYVGGRYASRPGLGIGAIGGVIGYRNRGGLVSNVGAVSPLYGVSRFNTQPQHSSFGGVRGPSRVDESPSQFGRRGAPGTFNTTPTSRGQPVRGMHENVPTRVDSRPPRFDPRPRGASQPERVQPRPNVDTRPTRVEPRAEPRSAPQPRPTTDSRPMDSRPMDSRPMDSRPMDSRPMDSRPTRVEPRAEPQPRMDSRPEPQPRMEPRPEPRPEPQPRMEPRPEPRPQPRAESRPQPQYQPRAEPRGGGGGGGGGRRGGGGGGGGRRP